MVSSHYHPSTAPPPPTLCPIPYEGNTFCPPKALHNSIPGNQIHTSLTDGMEEGGVCSLRTLEIQVGEGFPV